MKGIGSNMKKITSLLCSAVLLTSLLAGCGTPATTADEGATPPATPAETAAPANFDATKDITVISREASSGTRSAFDELMKIKVKDGETETNLLFPEAVIVNSTDEVSSKVEVDPFAIGYTSLGSVNAQVKALKIDGQEASEQAVKDGSYKVSRDLIIATPGAPAEPAADFIKFISSKQGQEIVLATGFIQVDEAAAEYAASGATGKITMSGSTSCEKSMEKLKEAYQALNADVTIEINYSGSGAGIKDALAKKVDIAMSSRNLTADETAALTPVIFAHDGIAIIVNKDNPMSELTSQQVTDIFTGNNRTWDSMK